MKNQYISIYRTRHAFHLVNYSPWPFFVSMASFSLAASAILYFQMYSRGGVFLFFSFIALVFLVSFWFTRIAANQSSISAFLTNRVGDCFLTIGMFAILWSFGNVDYSTVFSIAPFISDNIIILVGTCLLIGAMAKSSQIGFFPLV